MVSSSLTSIVYKPSASLATATPQLIAQTLQDCGIKTKVKRKPVKKQKQSFSIATRISPEFSGQLMDEGNDGDLFQGRLGSDERYVGGY
jgi:hypothetical protein